MFLYPSYDGLTFLYIPMSSLCFIRFADLFIDWMYQYYLIHFLFYSFTLPFLILFFCSAFRIWYVMSHTASLWHYLSDNYVIKSWIDLFLIMSRSPLSYLTELFLITFARARAHKARALIHSFTPPSRGRPSYIF